jgi:hypothetical protein
MSDVGQSAGEHKGEKSADCGKRAGLTPETSDAENEERRNSGKQFAGFERDKARNHNSRGNGSQGREKGFSQREASV